MKERIEVSSTTNPRTRLLALITLESDVESVVEALNEATVWKRETLIKSASAKKAPTSPEPRLIDASSRLLFEDGVFNVLMNKEIYRPLALDHLQRLSESDVAWERSYDLNIAAGVLKCKDDALKLHYFSCLCEGKNRHGHTESNFTRNREKDIKKLITDYLTGFILQKSTRCNEALDVFINRMSDTIKSVFGIPIVNLDPGYVYLMELYETYDDLRENILFYLKNPEAFERFSKAITDNLNSGKDLSKHFVIPEPLLLDYLSPINIASLAENGQKLLLKLMCKSSPLKQNPINQFIEIANTQGWRLDWKIIITAIRTPEDYLFVRNKFLETHRIEDWLEQLCPQKGMDYDYAEFAIFFLKFMNQPKAKLVTSETNQRSMRFFSHLDRDLGESSEGTFSSIDRLELIAEDAVALPPTSMIRIYNSMNYDQKRVMIQEWALSRSSFFVDCVLTHDAQVEQVFIQEYLNNIVQVHDMDDPEALAYYTSQLQKMIRSDKLDPNVLKEHLKFCIETHEPQAIDVLLSLGCITPELVAASNLKNQILKARDPLLTQRFIDLRLMDVPDSKHLLMLARIAAIRGEEQCCQYFLSLIPAEERTTDIRYFMPSESDASISNRKVTAAALNAYGQGHIKFKKQMQYIKDEVTYAVLYDKFLLNFEYNEKADLDTVNLSSLGQDRQQIAHNSKSIQADQFGKSRHGLLTDGGIKTTYLTERYKPYIDAMLYRLSEKIRSNTPIEGLNSPQIFKVWTEGQIIPTGDILFNLDGSESIRLTVYPSLIINEAPSWYHTFPEELEKCLAIIILNYAQLASLLQPEKIHPDNPSEEFIRLASLIHWLLAHACFYIRGSASISEAIIGGIFAANGYQLDWGDTMPDCIALTTTNPEEFFQIYKSILQVHPLNSTLLQMTSDLGEDHHLIH